MTPVLLVVLIVAGLTGCSGQPAPPADPLLERIFSTESGEELSRQELLAILSEQDVIYLGEKHDHPDQHRLQETIIRLLVDAGHKPAIGFEVVAVPDTSLLMAYTAGAPSHYGAVDPERQDRQLAERLGWGAIESENWQFYGPVLQLARSHELRVFGADLPMTLRGRITMVGRQGLSGVELRQLPDSKLIDENYQQMMFAQFKAAHCGWGSDEYLAKLYQNWLARNDSMSQAIVDMHDGNPSEPVVLITGAGHVAFNQGVYERVAALRPELRQVNLGLIELEPQSPGLDSYRESMSFNERDYGYQHEYLWFTRALERNREDLCKEFTRRESVDAGNHAQPDSPEQDAP